jgi:hypothetical protein
MHLLETLKNHQPLSNIKKCDFSQQSLKYLWYVIGGGELKIDPMKMEAILKWLFPTNFIEVSSFVWVEKYLQKFIASFSTMVMPLHAITSDKHIQWGNNQQKYFDELKWKINQALVLTLSNL